MNRVLVALLGFWALALSSLAGAQGGPPRPIRSEAPEETDAIPLYGAETPGEANTEIWGRMADGRWMVRNVSRPTLTPVLPAPEMANGAAVIVIPGGAFMGLAIGHEGWDVARALADRGIAAFVLKYRVIPTPENDDAAMAFMSRKVAEDIANAGKGRLLSESSALPDAQAALAMVRANAVQWGVDRTRVGMIGFSAGAMTARASALAPNPSPRPDFFGYVYGPQDAADVPADAPAMFDAIAWDDALFPTRGFAIAEAWRAAGRPVELHAYQTGNHGFGMGATGTTNAMLIDQFVAWIAANGWLEQTMPETPASAGEDEE